MRETQRSCAMLRRFFVIAAVLFAAAAVPVSAAETRAAPQVITLGGGCFWCLEAVFDELKGVSAVESGYAGGHVAKPSYEQVETGTTGHAETVQITFDPAVV